MSDITVTDSFLGALSDLDRTEAVKVPRFLRKLVEAPRGSSLSPEIVREASDRTIRSYRVSRDLRAIARIEGDSVTLLYVGQHEDAYGWARRHCTECHYDTHELHLWETDRDASDRVLQEYRCSDTARLCAVLDEHGIVHDLHADA